MNAMSERDASLRRSRQHSLKTYSNGDLWAITNQNQPEARDWALRRLITKGIRDYDTTLLLRIILYFHTRPSFPENQVYKRFYDHFPWEKLVRDVNSDDFHWDGLAPNMSPPQRLRRLKRWYRCACIFRGTNVPAFLLREPPRRCTTHVPSEPDDEEDLPDVE